MLSSLSAWMLSLFCRYCLIVHDHCLLDLPYSSLYCQTLFLPGLDGRYLKEQPLAHHLLNSTSSSDDFGRSSKTLNARSAQIGDICSVQGQRSRLYHFRDFIFGY